MVGGKSYNSRFSREQWIGVVLGCWGRHLENFADSIAAETENRLNQLNHMKRLYNIEKKMFEKNNGKFPDFPIKKSIKQTKTTA